MRRDRAMHSGHRLVRAVVLVGLALFVVGVYVVVVVGVGALLGRTDEPSLLLSVLATAVVALGFERVQLWLETAAARRLSGSDTSPYEVLSRFSETVTGGYATDELPGRMAELLGRGTGAQWAQVWLSVQDRLVLAASWPPEAAADTAPPRPEAGGVDATGAGRHALLVRHGGQVYGVFRLQEQPATPLTSVEERLFLGLAAQAGLVMRLVGLRAELAARHDDLSARADELRASRGRLVAAQDAERRRLERDIHDGAQQHLVALAVNLRLAETVAARSQERAAGLLVDQAAAAETAIATLSELSRGVYPPRLAAEGLLPALRAAAATSPLPVHVDGDAVDRLPPAVETALYFVAMEALQNAAKHAGPGAVHVSVQSGAGQACVTVRDEGTGFDAAALAAHGGGAGLVNMRDRMDAVGGSVSISSTPGAGTEIVATAPVLVPWAEPVGTRG